MARVDMRTVSNKTGVVYNPASTTIIYAEDVLAVKTAIDDATAGINTEKLEIGGVTVINSSGTIQDGAGVKSSKEIKLGSDCSGTDGNSGRILTLANTKLTTNIMVIASGIFLHETLDYTLTHNTTSSTITFINPVWDIMNIEVLYFS